jgi:lipopolysaccharide export LptBFGC system permease protein LptF
VRQSRSVRSRGLLIGLAVILAYYFLITAGVTLVRQHVLPAPLGLWIPDLALAIAGVLAFRHASGERLRRPRKMKAAH